MLHYVPSGLVMLFNVMFCCIMLRYVCYVIWRYVTLCYFICYIFCYVMLLTAHDWQKRKSTFLTCHCNEIYSEDTVGLKKFELYFKNYSLNVKRVKWLLFNRVKSVRNTLTEWKSLSKRVKIIPKWVKITPKKSENHSNRVNFTFLGKLTEGPLETNELSLSELPQKVKFTLFGVIFTHFGMIFTRFKSNFHSVRVVFTLFTLLKSNHFPLLH